jgi:hypothetical protein
MPWPAAVTNARFPSSLFFVMNTSLPQILNSIRTQLHYDRGREFTLVFALTFSHYKRFIIFWYTKIALHFEPKSRHAVRNRVTSGEIHAN